MCPHDELAAANRVDRADPPGPALYEMTGIEYFLLRSWPAGDDPAPS